jgi:DNA-binding response OmpR family regulator
VRAAESVQQLVRSLMEHGTPDLLLLDVMLPDGSGFDVLAKLRRHSDYASLPVVLLTAKSDPADIAKGLALGADGYVTKPYSKSILAGVISGILE